MIDTPNKIVIGSCQAGNLTFPPDPESTPVGRDRRARRVGGWIRTARRSVPTNDLLIRGQCQTVPVCRAGTRVVSVCLSPRARHQWNGVSYKRIPNR